MVYDLSVILIVRDAQFPVKEIVVNLNDMLNERSVTHEFVIVYPLPKDEQWSECCALSSEYKNISAVRIAERIPYESSILCGASMVNSHYSFVLPNNHALDYQDIFVCYVAMTKSNIELLYAFQRSNRTFLKLPSFFYRQVFRIFSGVSAYRSETFIFRSNKAYSMRVKTPFYFLFDRLLFQWIDHSMHLELKASRNSKTQAHSGFYLLIQFLANSYIIEFSIILLLSLNIMILLKAKLLLSFVLACISILLIWTAYLIKWRRRIAYKVLERC